MLQQFDFSRLGILADGRLHHIEKEPIRIFLGYACFKCGVDFKDLPSRHRHIHHKDENRSNQSQDNLELLCLDCHMTPHKLRNTYNRGKKGVEQYCLKPSEEKKITLDFIDNLGTVKALAKKYKVGPKSISKAINLQFNGLTSKVVGIKRCRTNSKVENKTWEIRWTKLRKEVHDHIRKTV